MTKSFYRSVDTSERLHRGSHDAPVMSLAFSNHIRSIGPRWLVPAAIKCFAVAYFRYDMIDTPNTKQREQHPTKSRILSRQRSASYRNTQADCIRPFAQDSEYRRPDPHQTYNLFTNHDITNTAPLRPRSLHPSSRRRHRSRHQRATGGQFRAVVFRVVSRYVSCLVYHYCRDVGSKEGLSETWVGDWVWGTVNGLVIGGFEGPRSHRFSIRLPALAMLWAVERCICKKGS
ncbi:uncharacterized protein K489DRAFT_58845 [Dissoconium aciculare CBS 342.82]|uniref:Uncharacterized protein n=1 Tax=Dissoconium aciculare CBS 342.82 TaxID=1314786 RepID=A0A6J3LVK6_9PEZI|nr:uncharacterized protein K489DRAFT_58845 [Dissoconium aciculare CBS 342.82]KAF1819791.1 hypothetical protein K489DRAFT_58845 [Dissoconium aciculare CBS 342.82]